MDNRPGWDDYFLTIATAVAARSDCRRSQVGAVLVDAEHRIYSTGYPGTAAGAKGCLAGACPRGKLSAAQCAPGSDYSNCISIHAEVNALMRADFGRHPGSTLYVTRQPCDWCAKVINASGLDRVVWPGGVRSYVRAAPPGVPAGASVTITGGSGFAFGDGNHQYNVSGGVA